MTEMQKSIISTLAFFDLFDHPLTAYELFSYLSLRGARRATRQSPAYESRGSLHFVRDDSFTSWTVFQPALDELAESKKVVYKDGFISLADRPYLDVYRRKRQECIVRKMKRAIRAIKLLRWIPFIQTVAICNRLSVGHPNKDSDLDVFIIIKNGRLWLGRFFATVWMQIMGLRRHGGRIANRICLSFYITPAAAALNKIALKKQQDVYLCYWTAHLLPVWTRKCVFDEFWQENEWAHGSTHQTPMPEPLLQVRIPCSVRFVELLLQMRLGDIMEKVIKKIQKQHINRVSREHKLDSAVVVSDSMLKFHEEDRRLFYTEQWLERKRGFS